MARPTKGAEHVMALPGTRESKRRAKLILDTISEKLSVKEACEQLGIGPTQFANLRQTALLGLLGALQPKPDGRPRRVPEEVQQELDALRQQVADLERENHVLQVQAEVSGLRRQPPLHAKSDGAAALRRAPPRKDAAGGAVP